MIRLKKALSAPKGGQISWKWDPASDKLQFKRVIKLIHVLLGWVKRLAIFDVVDYDIFLKTKYHPTTDRWRICLIHSNYMK